MFQLPGIKVSKMKKYLVLICLLNALTSQHAIAETWECQVVYDYSAFINGDFSEATKHIFVRASSDEYVHTYEASYIDDEGDSFSRQETQDLQVIYDGSLSLFAGTADVTGSTSVSLRQISAKGPFVQISEHGLSFPIEGAGICNITCNEEDKIRMRGADEICDQEKNKLKNPWSR